MKIKSLQIINFKSIKEIIINDIDSALILVGKNNTGKSSILSALKVLTGDYQITPFDYNEKGKSIKINLTIELNDEDLAELHALGKVNKFRNFDRWLDEFYKRIPSYQNGIVKINCRITVDGEKKFTDGVQKHNGYIIDLIPSIFSIDENRRIDLINNLFLEPEAFTDLEDVKNNLCIFDSTKKCIECFNCIQVIYKKTPEALTLYETILLTKFKLYSANLISYENSINKYFKKNYGSQYEIHFKFHLDMQALLKIYTYTKNLDNHNEIPIEEVSSSMKSLYILSIFQAYLDTERKVSSIIIVDQPEMHLHPELQRITSEILYKLSKKNQVFFTTHSPTMLFNFSAKQIKQIVLNQEHQISIRENTNLDLILEDLGYSANDLMNVSFVFIVEGKDDLSRLPLLLDRHYSEIRDEEGQINRIAIITTNSCTNIKTYANLKYINQTYLKDNFLMIRDSDGKDPEILTEQLCSYYFNRMNEDAKIPRITPRNVLVLKYYSFENYFLNPEIMVKLNIIDTVDSFYEILYDKYKQYLVNMKCTKNMFDKTSLNISSKEDIRNNIETFKIYMRGHNLFDIFYSKYKTREEQNLILKQYIEFAPRDEFKDILDAIDAFVYFDNRKI